MTYIQDEQLFPRWPENDHFSEDEYLQALSAGGPYEDRQTVSPELRQILEAQFDTMIEKYFPNCHQELDEE